MTTWPASKLQLQLPPSETGWLYVTSHNTIKIISIVCCPLSTVMDTITSSFEGQLHSVYVRGKYCSKFIERTHLCISLRFSSHCTGAPHPAVLCFQLLLSTRVFPSWLTLRMSKEEVYVNDVEEYSQGRPGPTLTFHNLHYCVQDKFLCWKRGPVKYVLKDVR